jgi:secreted PhoX family phosphatase
MRLSDLYPPVAVRDRDDIGSNPTLTQPIQKVIEARLARRDLLKGLAAGAAVGVFGGTMTSRLVLAADNPSTLTFEEVAHGIDENHHVAKGYTANVLIRWGDKLADDAPDFDIKSQSVAGQEKQFGYNCDFVAFMPLPAGSSNSESGLLCVNHEYTNAELMFPGLTADDKLDKLTKDQVEIEMAAHGHTVVEIRKTGGAWQVVADSPHNRRITTGSTKILVSGPAAGHDLLKTSADASGKEVIGTVNNCAGGWTPWGTVLVAEENFNNYFAGAPEEGPQAAAYKRYGVGKKSEYAWSKFNDRFNVAKEPNEPNRFGWMVEYDPYDAAAVPVKRTALGRFKHEGATTVLNKDGRVVVYAGDDERFDYLYKFVTAGTYDANDRAASMNLLDEGTLYVAKFGADGKVQWLPLIHGEGGLTAENGFASQADVVIHARLASDKVGATPMDRPEDVEVNPVSGKVYAVMTNNDRRKIDQIDAANPRFANTAGHIIELTPPGGEGKDADHAASEFDWSFFIIAGDPTWGSTQYGKGTSKNGWFSAPDNVAFDPKGRIWITTDQGGSQKKFGIGDGVYAADCSGDGRAVSRFFFRVPADAEMCGPAFTPDGKTLFLAVQHPGEGTSFDEPSTRWPDFAEGMPPRPSIVAITKDDGGDIGT